MYSGVRQGDELSDCRWYIIFLLWAMFVFEIFEVGYDIVFLATRYAAYFIIGTGGPGIDRSAGILQNRVQRFGWLCWFSRNTLSFDIYGLLALLFRELLPSITGSEIVFFMCYRILAFFKDIGAIDRSFGIAGVDGTADTVRFRFVL